MHIRCPVCDHVFPHPQHHAVRDPGGQAVGHGGICPAPGLECDFYGLYPDLEWAGGTNGNGECRVTEHPNGYRIHPVPSAVLGRAGRAGRRGGIASPDDS